MASERIRQQWNLAFPDTVPVGAICRDLYLHRWVRVHSLPESKRYAETEPERREVLRRYNRFGSHVLGEGEPCVLFVSKPQLGNGEAGVAGKNPFFAEDLIPVSTMAHAEQEFTVEARESIWHTGGWDTVLSEVADDKAPFVLFFSAARSAIFAPYDGGADAIFSTAAQADAARELFRSWLSSRTDGY